MRWWKIAGLAAFVGVTATGVVVARGQRRRNAYTPEQVRTRLHARLAEVEDTAADPPRADVEGTPGRAVRSPTEPDAATRSAGPAVLRFVPPRWRFRRLARLVLRSQEA